MSPLSMSPLSMVKSRGSINTLDRQLVHHPGLSCCDKEFCELTLLQVSRQTSCYKCGLITWLLFCMDNNVGLQKSQSMEITHFYVLNVCEYWTISILFLQNECYWGSLKVETMFIIENGYYYYDQPICYKYILLLPLNSVICSYYICLLPDLTWFQH